jgi:hypothetical protein
MATLALSLAGQVVGGAIGGPIGATIGRALGALAGSAIDATLFSERGAAPSPAVDIRLQGSTQGAPIPRLYGWSRVTGNIIWATELEAVSSEGAGAKGTAPAENETEILASFAIGLCAGQVQRLGRIWADGELLSSEGLTLRFYPGSETQLVDSLIEAKQGADAPAYRGLCYIVFERLPLGRFGNRIPNLSVELCRVAGELEPAIRAVTVIPGATEFGYDPVLRVRLLSPGTTTNENAHQSARSSDWTLSLDELTALCPNLEHVALVLAWFGDDLRAGECSIAPRVEAAARTVQGTSWSVAGLGRGDAQLVSQHEGGPAYGGTPSDAAVRAAIADLKARGLKVTLYPILLMDIAADNPMSQPAYPWRGRITGTPADVAGLAPDYADFVLHYAALAAAAGGVDAFLIGSELVGLTSIRDGLEFPFVEALVELAADVKVLLPGAKLTYAADWSEYAGVQSGEGEKLFHLDPLWASPAIDAVGIDNYMPIADWRDGSGHADAAGFDSMHQLDYLDANIAGGEGFDWFYASDADRLAGLRTPIADDQGEPWIWRFKDLAGWWSQPHHDRPGGVRSATPTAWVPASKPIWFTELGCGAVDKGANQPNVFGDEKSSEDGRPWFSSGAADPLLQRQVLRAQLRHWAGSDMVERIYLWTWDARPFPAFPLLGEVWADGVNHATGHWLTGRLGALAADELAVALAADFGVTLAASARPPLLEGYLVEGQTSLRDALEPVLAVTGLVVREGAEGLELGRSRGREVTPVPDLVAAAPRLSRKRPDPGEATGRLALTGPDRLRDYLSATVTAMRPGGGAAASQVTSLVLEAGGARLAAERLLLELATSRETLELTLPPSLLALEPGDVISVPGEGEEPFEIAEIRDGEARRVLARSLAPVLELAIATDRPVPVAALVVTPALPLLALAQLPPEPADAGRARLLLGAHAAPWPGRVSITDAATGEPLARLGRSAGLGELLAPLLPGTPHAWDEANTIDLRLWGGHLAAAEPEAVLAGANRLAIETDDGDWEVIGFAQAELVAPGTYRLARLLRGREGTDHAIGPASAGARVLLLDGRPVSLPVPAAWLGTERSLRAYAGGGDEEGQGLLLALDLAPSLPLAPVHLLAERLPGSEDVTLAWVRRSRADPDNWALEDAPADLLPEAYRLTILDGATVVRSRICGEPGATYAAAEQIADFGLLPAGFDFEVAQLSPVLGAGHAGRGRFQT